MASSVSLLNNYNGSLFTFANKELLMQGLMMKQGAYDLNKSRLEQLRHQVGFLDVAKTSDQEYLNKRLAEADNIIKSTIENGDLSNTYLVDQISSKIESIIDEPILNAVVSTSARRQEEKQWKEAKEANDGSYSDINYTVMSHNWNKYLSDDRVGTKYQGGGGFTPFVDLDKIYTSKEFNQYLKDAGINAEYIVNSSGVGQFQAINKYEGTVDPGRLRQAIEAFGGEPAKKQMQINSIYNYGYGNNSESVNKLRNDYNSRIESYLNNAEAQKEAIDVELNSNISSERRQYLISQKEIIERNINENQSLNFDRDVVGEDGYIDENKFTSLASNVYSNNKMDEIFDLTYMSPIWKDKSLDQVQSKYIEFQERQRQFNLNYDLRERQFELNVANYDLSVAKAGFITDPNTGQLIPITGAGVSSLNQQNVQMGTGVPVTKEEAPDFNILKSSYEQLQSAIDGIYRSTGGEWSKSATAELQKQLAIRDGFAIGDEFKLKDGTILKVTPENIKYIQTLSDVSTGQNTTLSQLSVVLEKSVLGLGSEGGGGNSGSIDWKTISDNFSTIQPANVTLVKNSDGTYYATTEKLSGAKNNNLQYLAWKINTKGWDKLTDNEKMTANYYKVKILQNNDNFGKEEKSLMERAFYKSMGGNLASLKNAENRAMSIDPNAAINLIKVGVDDQSALSSMYQYYRTRNAISDVTSSDNLNTPLQNNNLVDRDKRKLYEGFKDVIIDNSRSIIERTKIVVSPPVHSSGRIKDAENIQYTSIKNLIDLPVEYKGSITFTRIIREGKPTSNFKVEIDNPTGTASEGKEYDKKELSVIIPESKLRTAGVQLYLPEDTPYNTKLGSFSATSSIIPSNSFKSKTVGNVNIPEGTPAYYSNNIRQGLDAWQEQIKVATGNNDFNIYQEIQSDPLLRNPKVTIQPIDGEYYTVFGDSRKGGIAFGDPLGEKVETDAITASKVVGDNIIIAGMKEYLSKKLNVEF